MKSTLRNLLFLTPFLSLSFGISVASASVQKENYKITNVNDNRAIYQVAQAKYKSPKFRKKAGMRLKAQDGSIIPFVPKLKKEPVANQRKPKPLHINNAPKVGPV